MDVQSCLSKSNSAFPNDLPTIFLHKVARAWAERSLEESVTCHVFKENGTYCPTLVCKVALDSVGGIG